MATPEKIDIGLKNDQIMQRYLVRRIHKEVEFKIKEADGTESVGFITGFDETVIQVSITPEPDVDEPRAVLIFWPIAKIEETGRRVQDLTEAQAVKIQSYTHALRKQCASALTPDALRVPPPLSATPFTKPRR